MMRERSTSSSRAHRRRRGAAVLVVLAVYLVLGQGTTDAALLRLPRLPPHPGFVSGTITAPGGPFFRDAFGRAVLFHGVNAVYKHPPFELLQAPGKPYDFSATDASRIAGLGFDVVRLGIFWAGLEPGTDPPNDPAICTAGRPRNPHQLNLAVLHAYLAGVKRTVDLLGRFHVYTLLDMHQDLYSSVFGGDGSPPWAVCTNGLSTARLPGRWSNTYASPGLDTAFGHFWTNDVAGNLQGQYDQVWGLVARYFAHDPWILGYDLMNEPFSPAVHEVSHHLLDTQIECFYTGRGHPGERARLRSAAGCPPQDPAKGLIPTIEANDHRHLVFYEPDIYTAKVGSADIGPMNFPRLVFNFHSYCPQRNPVTGNPPDVAACADHVLAAIGMHQPKRKVTLARASRPPIPPAFMSEFGASGNPSLISTIVNGADRALLSWCYWAWKYYDDPTGSSDEALVTATGSLKATAGPLAEPYPEAVAGTPRHFRFRPANAQFSLSYVPAPDIRAPTIVSTPRVEYPDGYCPRVRGAQVVSPPGASRLLLANDPAARFVTLTIRTGTCSYAFRPSATPTHGNRYPR